MIIALLLLVIPLIVVAVNWYVNPYSIYKVPKLPLSNLWNPDLVAYSYRMIKPYQISKYKPSSIILGTSQTEAFDLNHRGFQDKVLNLGLGTATIYEMLKLFEYASNTGNLKQAIVLLDFMSFDGDRLTKKFWNEKWFNPYNVICKTLFSVSALKLSYICLKEKVFPSAHTMQSKTSECDNTEQWFKNHIFHNGEYRLGNTLDYYRQIFKIAHKNGIDLKLMTTPCHVRRWQTIRDIGIYPLFQYWKSELIRINKEEGGFDLWDFSIENEYTTDAQYYGDASHFKRPIADMILNNVFGYSNSFGIRR